MKKYTVNGYKNGHLVESHETNEICSAYEQYRHLGTPQGEIVDTEYSEVFESYGFEEQGLNPTLYKEREAEIMAIISLNGFIVAKKRVTKEEIKLYESNGFTVTIIG